MKIFICLLLLTSFTSCIHAPFMNFNRDEILIRFGSGFHDNKVDLFINDSPILMDEEISSDLSIGIDPRFKILVERERVIKEKIGFSKNVLDTFLFENELLNFTLVLDIDNAKRIHKNVYLKNGNFLYLNLQDHGNLKLEYIKKRKPILY